MNEKDPETPGTGEDIDIDSHLADHLLPHYFEQYMGVNPPNSDDVEDKDTEEDKEELQEIHDDLEDQYQSIIAGDAAYGDIRKFINSVLDFYEQTHEVPHPQREALLEQLDKEYPEHEPRNKV